MSQSSIIDSPLMNEYELMTCIERGLNKFGRSIKYAVMWRMVVLGKSPKQGLLSNPQAFVSALESIFGASAKVIEWEIMDQIKAKSEPEYSEVEDLVILLSLLARKQKNDLCEHATTSQPC